MSDTGYLLRTIGALIVLSLLIGYLGAWLLVAGVVAVGALGIAWFGKWLLFGRRVDRSAEFYGRS